MTDTDDDSQKADVIQQGKGDTGGADQTNPTPGTATARAAAREKLKERFKGRRQPKPRKAVDKPKVDYDNLPPAQQDHYWSEDGRLTFLEQTGERSYPQWVIDRAFELYADGIPLEAIAVQWDIELTLVSKWARSQSWQRKLDRIREAVDDKVTRDKVKQVVSKRQELDAKHEGIINMLYGEAKWELDKQPGPQDDPMRFAQLKRTKMQTLEIAYRVFKGLIETERMVVGIDASDTGGNQLPTDLRITIAGAAGEDLTDMEALRAALPSQDPHNYTPAANPSLALPEPQEGTVLPDRQSDTIEPVVIAPGPHSAADRAVPVKPVIDPVRLNQFGAIDSGPSAPPPITHPLGMLGNWLGGGM